MRLLHQAAVRQMPAGPRRPVVDDQRAQAAPDAVRRDQRVALDIGDARGLQPHGPVALRRIEYARAGVQPRACQLRGGKQRVLEVGPVHGEVGRAVALHHRLAELQHGELAAVGAVARAQPRRRDHLLRQRSGQKVPFAQDARRVGSHLDARTDFGAALGLLEQAHVPAGTAARHRSGEPADAAAGDQQLAAHAASE
jgi:hypothetical protein